MPHLPSPAAVRQLLATTALPGGAHADVRPIEEGGEHSSWWVGADHVLRLALDIDGSVRQRREIALRDLVRPRVGAAVPASVAHGEWTAGRTYTLDTKLPGTSAERRPVSRAGEADLAGLLAGLRSVEPAKAVAVGLPQPTPRALDELWRTALRAGERLVRDGEFSPVHRAQLSAAPAGLSRTHHPRDAAFAVPPDQAQPSAPDPVATVGHHDLKGEHLLVTAGGRVGGVLDWTDAALGDPAEDIAGLTISVGAPAAVRAAELAGYGPAIWLRGVLLARFDTLVRLADRCYEGEDSPLPLLRAQRDRAWLTLPTAQPTRPAP
ncbi:aminoglycoside phosphotransferase family protein [Streptomyces zagrosensis]|uniref:Aminoglycoside phosphotransferase (APT) family kinase protein n=1 Tax=Streptomyces zagrosensis TaxID=1042984 RepID=A0A7W9QDL6_9ACTN|nr:aminoglycoside phosphotransferase family protein [Streptomyces zagrosensis]MBB5938348.1 aminoglycoside phosphotransferase (APT) family kinase protein [Streptomyces zagrosensis]